MTSSPSSGDIVEKLRERAKRQREFVAHAEANRDDWFSTMPPEISAEAIEDAELDEQAAAEITRLRSVGEEVERVKAALFDYLAECCSYHYGEGQPPSPPEFGISWSWQASTPERPGLHEQLRRDAFAYFDRYVNEIDPDEEPTDWDRQVMAHRAALAARRSQP